MTELAFVFLPVWILVIVVLAAVVYIDTWQSQLRAQKAWVHIWLEENAQDGVTVGELMNVVGGKMTHWKTVFILQRLCDEGHVRREGIYSSYGGILYRYFPH